MIRIRIKLNLHELSGLVRLLQRIGSNDGRILTLRCTAMQNRNRVRTAKGLLTLMALAIAPASSAIAMRPEPAAAVQDAQQRPYTAPPDQSPTDPSQPDQAKAKQKAVVVTGTIVKSGSGLCSEGHERNGLSTRRPRQSCAFREPVGEGDRETGAGFKRQSDRYAPCGCDRTDERLIGCHARRRVSCGRTRLRIAQEITVRCGPEPRSTSLRASAA